MKSEKQERNSEVVNSSINLAGRKKELKKSEKEKESELKTA